MTFLSEDPTYVAGSLALVAVCLLMAVKATQRGKYLVWSFALLGLAAGVVAIEHFWVTDNERIEAVVYDLRRAVLASDADGVLAHLTPEVEYVHDGNALSGEATRALIKANLGNATFDFVHVQELQASAGRQTRRGKAEFRVYAKGTLKGPMMTYNVGTANSTWSLGFEESAPGVWKVNRITPVSISEGAISVPRSGSLRPPSAEGPGVHGDGQRGRGSFPSGLGPRRPQGGRLRPPTTLKSESETSP